MQKSENSFGEMVKTIVFAILLAFLFRSFAFEPFHIPSGSMKSTLLEGDYLFVTKFSYGYGPYSFWPLPASILPLKHRIFEVSEPERGDIVVFRPPGQPSQNFIKRLVGLPGDRIQMKDGVLYINDKMVPKEYVDNWTDFDFYPPKSLKRYRETMPEGKTYQVLDETPTGDVDNTDVYTVPAGHYFMMGDNRDNSRDSRFSDPVGFVPANNLVGRADFILFSWSFAGGFHLRGDRFFVHNP